VPPLLTQVDTTALDEKVRSFSWAVILVGVAPIAEAESAKAWVYSGIEILSELPSFCGVYATDLGPTDSRDAALVQAAFGAEKLEKLRELKRQQDPHNLLRFACPLLTNE